MRQAVDQMPAKATLGQILQRGVGAGKLPDTALEDLPEGGFGWHLIHSLTNDLTYLRTGGCNRLRFLLPLA